MNQKQNTAIKLLQDAPKFIVLPYTSPRKKRRWIDYEKPDDEEVKSVTKLDVDESEFLVREVNVDQEILSEYEIEEEKFKLKIKEEEEQMTQDIQRKLDETIKEWKHLSSQEKTPEQVALKKQQQKKLYESGGEYPWTEPQELKLPYDYSKYHSFFNPSPENLLYPHSRKCQARCIASWYRRKKERERWQALDPKFELTCKKCGNKHGKHEMTFHKMICGEMEREELEKLGVIGEYAPKVSEK